MPLLKRNIPLHPSNHLPLSLSRKTYDVIVLGSGPAGRRLASLTASAKLGTVIVENELFGGDCPFWACIPSKALLRPNEALGAGRQMGGSKQMIQECTPDGSTIDVQGVFKRRDGIVQGWDDTILLNLSLDQGVDVVRGQGKLTGVKKVEVTNLDGNQVVLEATQAVVLATGSEATIPKIEGLDQIDWWTSREATAANFVPEHLVILGGGVIGCEMATFYGSLGKRVTLISSSKRLLPRCEPEASELVKKSLTALGVEVCLSTAIDKLSKVDKDKFKADLASGDHLTGSVLLLATGRRASTQDLGLEDLGVKVHPKLEVSESLCVATATGKWLYAIGDANGRNPMTHMGVYQARTAGLAIIARSRKMALVEEPFNDFSATADHEMVPQIIFTDPHVAMVGLTAAQAEAKGLNAKIVAVPFMFPGAFVHAELNYEGWAQWVIDEDTKILVGATIVGREAGDLLHASTVAIVGRIPVPKLWHAVASFPSMSEVYTALLMASGY
ncbi:uncharacterized protein HMPREF1541_09090 [Cyphellophora europaea CBS 101466]|uniref:FAD/NAD(P)-binding domain-containing protein n=1 Tax=Cyphellophora europaea (strain CBS 101466) TaxID=1220924 RepID=W2SBF8_CYPE1|nr:uncharacterized protein HMPREF1541_09090 [Cyphellophora europaea CBS 101466]ETN45259.1 hypothetical protein HMPREF1541_09090 [Cyphellophora europaea CBS 101466]